MIDPYATRGARKLQAALRAFGLDERVAGAAAIDVGASTGGFTATLLARGAREVTAVDVGTGQLAQVLRGDPRVHVYEQTDLRRAPLALAPGPFDFFTVDVSFMAARNVLRPLAFRLRDGAEGVVLLKPQFELPSSEVRGGEVGDPRLRSRALRRFTGRAEKLGFRVLSARDSEVAGGSGTIEILLHVRFDGRTEALPKPGERRGEATARAPRSRPSSASALDALRWFAIAAPGLEAVLAEELGALPQVIAPRAVPGGVEFQGALAAGYAVNLHSRIATRVLVRLGEVRAREFAQLRRRLAALPFEAFVRPDRPLRIDASARGCRLYHTKALAQQLLLAVGDKLGTRMEASEREGVRESEREGDGDDTKEDTQGVRESEREGGGDDTNADAQEVSFGQEAFARLSIRGESDRFTVSVDSSGLLLHRRGARRETGRAPLRETLAAAMLTLAGYTGDEPLVDAMCGAGTIALEAVDIALARAPGRLRGFAFETFPCFRREEFAALHAAALRGERPALRAPIYAFDRRDHALDTARRNAERAGATQHIRFGRADALELAPPEPAGLWIANPPYGHRLGRTREVHALYEALGERLRRAWRGYRIALLVPRSASPRAFGLRQARSFALSNGGLPVQLLIGVV